MVAAFHQILSRRKPILTGKYIRTINQELRRPTQVGSSISEYYAKVGVLHWKTTEVKGTKLNENSPSVPFAVQRETTIAFASLNNFFGPQMDELLNLIGQRPERISNLS